MGTHRTGIVPPRPATGLLTAALAVLVLLAAGCGDGGDDTADATTTTAAATSTTVELVPPTDDTEPADTEPGDSQPDDSEPDDELLGPVGDESLFPLLLNPDEFGEGYEYASDDDPLPDEEVCAGVPFPGTWSATAGVSVQPSDEQVFGGMSETVVRFDTEDQASAVIRDFPGLADECAESTEDPQPKFTFTDLTGVGDEGFVGVPDESEDGLVVSAYFVRTGADVTIVFVYFDSVDPEANRAVVDAAVARVAAG